MITEEHLENSFTYKEYQAYSKDRFSQNMTTGEAPEVNTELYLHYTKLNLSRTVRVEKKVSLTDDIKEVLDSITNHQNWIVIVESWCGDVPHNLPVIHKMSLYQPLISLRILLRDNNLAIMDSYLTNGGRSIPKLIAFEKNLANEIFRWGPRPAALQAEIDKMKAKGTQYSEISEMSQKWYNKDAGKELQNELLIRLKR